MMVNSLVGGDNSNGGKDDYLIKTKDEVVVIMEYLPIVVLPPAK